MNNCLTCSVETSNPKFCSSSCSAKYNNKGIRRHGQPAGNCQVCGSIKKSSAQKYCSYACSGKARIVNKDPKLIKALNAEKQSRYRQKKYRIIHPTADRKLIREIYKNCPEGYEVDHIIPVSQGGLHHQDNLQYLTKAQNRSKGCKVVQEV